MIAGTLTVDCGAHPQGTRLLWSHSGSTSGVTFQVQYEVNGSGTWVNLAVLPFSTVAYTHDVESVVCNADLNYRVIELTNNVQTDVTNTVNCLNDCSLTPEIFPGLTMVCPTAYSAIRLTWTLNYPPNFLHSPFVSVNIYRDTDPAFLSPTLIATVPSGTGLYDDTNVVGGTDYYYNATYVFNTFVANEGPIALTQVSCSLPHSPCGSSSPLSTFNFNLEVSDDCEYIVLPGLLDSSGGYIVPGSHTCDDISAVTSVKARFAKCTSTIANATQETLNTSSTLYYNIINSFRFPVSSDGIYNIQLEVVYTDLLGNSKTITSTRCVLVSCNCLECDIATAIINEADNAEQLLLLYQGLQLISDCQDCQHACQSYQNIVNLLSNGCNC